MLRMQSFKNMMVNRFLKCDIQLLLFCKSNVYCFLRKVKNALLQIVWDLLKDKKLYCNSRKLL